MTVTFDLQAHRGGAGLWPENTLEAFGRGPRPRGLDARARRPPDRGRRRRRPPRPDRRRRADGSASSPAPTCRRRCRCSAQVAALLDERGADPVRVNLEIKYDALDAAELTTPRGASSSGVVDAAARSTGSSSAPASSASTGACCDRVGEAEPALARNLLVSPKYLERRRGRPSPWFDGLAVDDDFVATAAAAGLHGDLPDPRSAVPIRRRRPGVRALRDRRSWSTRAHAAGLAVIPYVVDDAPTMRHLVGLGVDGLITNHPDRLRDVLARRGPRACRPRFPRRRQPPAGPERLLRHDHLLPRGLARRPGGCRRPSRLAARAVADDARDLRSRGDATALLPTTVFDVSDLEQGDPPAVAWSERRSGRTVIHGTGGTTTPAPNGLDQFAPMGLGLRDPDHRRPAARRPAGSAPTARSASASGSTRLRAGRLADGEGRGLLGQGAAGSGPSTSGRARAALQPGPGLRQGAGGGAVRRGLQGERDQQRLHGLRQRAPPRWYTSSHGIVDRTPHLRLTSTGRGPWIGGITS